MKLGQTIFAEHLQKDQIKFRQPKIRKNQLKIEFAPLNPIIQIKPTYDKLKPLTYLKSKPLNKHRHQVNQRLNNLQVSGLNKFAKLNDIRTQNQKVSKKAQILNQLIGILKYQENGTVQESFPRKSMPIKKRPILTEQSYDFHNSSSNYNEFIDIVSRKPQTRKFGPRIVSNEITRLAPEFRARRRIYSQQKSRLKTHESQYKKDDRLVSMDITFYKEHIPVKKTQNMDFVGGSSFNKIIQQNNDEEDDKFQSFTDKNEFLFKI